MPKRVEIYTDGACRGNPGPGGWGALLRYKGHEKTLKGVEPLSTNNRMEVMAAIAALEALKHPCNVVLATDSKYLRDGVNEWIKRWKQRGWKTVNNKPVKNIDLWQRLDAAASRHNVEWRWIKGHSGHRDNERVDQLANQAIDEMLG